MHTGDTSRDSSRGSASVAGRAIGGRFLVLDICVSVCIGAVYIHPASTPRARQRYIKSYGEK